MIDELLLHPLFLIVNTWDLRNWQKEQIWPVLPRGLQANKSPYQELYASSPILLLHDVMLLKNHKHIQHPPKLFSHLNYDMQHHNGFVPCTAMQESFQQNKHKHYILLQPILQLPQSYSVQQCLHSKNVLDIFLQTFQLRYIPDHLQLRISYHSSQLLQRAVL